jgi:hypothetical protein
MKKATKLRYGNGGQWKARKTKLRFPSIPTALGNRCAISTFPQRRRLFLSPRNKTKIKNQKGPTSIRPSPRFRDHPSMRKCFARPLKHRTLGTSQTEPLPQGSRVAPSAEVFHFGLYRPILP